MAVRAEDMTYEELKRVVDPLCCRWADAITTPELPLGSFDLLTFPMTELNEADGNPTVHYFEVVRNHGFCLQGCLREEGSPTTPTTFRSESTRSQGHETAICHLDLQRWLPHHSEAPLFPREGQAELSEDADAVAWRAAQSDVHEYQSQNRP